MTAPTWPDPWIGMARTTMVKGGPTERAHSHGGSDDGGSGSGRGAGKQRAGDLGSEGQG
jgi:hypothetical protein